MNIQQLGYIALVQFLVKQNKELVDRTGLKDCHVKGLNSFIINEMPRMRLFIAEDHCPLFDKYDFRNPIIPIHPHKYNDLFIDLEGEMTNHLYVYPFHSDQSSVITEFKEYKYARLNEKDDVEPSLTENGTARLFYFKSYKDPKFLIANQLHSVSLKSDEKTGKCSWLIIEGEEDKNFQPIAYHQDLQSDKTLYKKFENAQEYLLKYF